MTAFRPKDPNYETRLRRLFASQPFTRHLGVELKELRPGFCALWLASHETLLQIHGYFHGGVVGTLADTAGGFAATSLEAEGDTVITIEYKVNFLAPGVGDALLAEGHVVKAGRSIVVTRSEVFAIKDNRRTLCAVGIQTWLPLRGVDAVTPGQLPGPEP